MAEFLLLLRNCVLCRRLLSGGSRLPIFYSGSHFLVHNNCQRQVPQNHWTVVQRGYYSADKSQPYAPIFSPCDLQGGEGRGRGAWCFYGTTHHNCRIQLIMHVCFHLTAPEEKRGPSLRSTWGRCSLCDLLEKYCLVQKVAGEEAALSIRSAETIEPPVG